MVSCWLPASRFHLAPHNTTAPTAIAPPSPALPPFGFSLNRVMSNNPTDVPNAAGISRPGPHL